MKKLAFLFAGGVAALAAVFAFTVRSSAELYGAYLNAQESLAIYGTSIPALWYTGAAVDDAVFQYIGNTFDLKERFEASDGGNGEIYPPPSSPLFSSGRGTMFWGTTVYDDQNSPGYITNQLIEGVNYLIYKWEPPVSTLPSASSFDFQIRVDFPLSVDCQAVGTSVFWSSGSGARRDFAATRSFMALYGPDGYADDTYKEVIGIRPSNSDFQNYYARAHFPSFLGNVVNYDGDTVSDRLLSDASPYAIGCAARAGSIADDAPTISVRGQLINIKQVTANQYPTTVDVSTGVYTEYTNPVVYLYIQCPIIYGDYEIIVPDSSDPDWDTVVDGVGNIVLSTDEIRQILLRMESVQSDILTVERVHTNQFIDMLSRLQAIYENMASSGEITVPDLHPAPDFQIDSAVDSRIVQQFQDFESPDFSEAVPHEEANSFFVMIHNFALWFPARVIAFYTVGLILSVCCWALFKGR